MPSYSSFDVTNLENVQSFARALVRGLRRGEQGLKLAEVGDHLPIAPAVPGVYLLLAQPTRYQPIFNEVRNWYDDQACFYVGEGADVRDRLMTHRRTLQEMVESEIANQRLDADGPRVVEHSIAYTLLEVRESAVAAQHERRFVEALLVAALRPIANDLGFGKGRLSAKEMWTIVGPMRSDTLNEALEEFREGYIWPVGEWGTEQAAFTSDDPLAQGEAHAMTDQELDYVRQYERLITEPTEEAEQRVAREEIARHGRKRDPLPPAE